MPKEIIMAIVTIKKAAAQVNSELNDLPAEISEAIQKASEEVIINFLFSVVFMHFHLFFFRS